MKNPPNHTTPSSTDHDRDNTSVLQKFRRVIENGAVGFVVGLLVTLVTLIPEDFLNDAGKLLIIILLILFTFVLIGVTIVREKFRQNTIMYSAIKEFHDFLPRIIKIARHSKEYKLDAEGNAVVSDSIRFSNLSGMDLPPLRAPIVLDIYDVDEDPLSHLKPVLEIESARIGREKIPDPKQCYRRVGTLTNPAGHKDERGYLLMPTASMLPDSRDSPNVIEGNDVETELVYRIRGALRDIHSDEGEAIIAEIHHPSDLVEIIVVAPPGEQIRLRQTTEHPRGISVNDKHAGFLDYKETLQIEGPQVMGGTRIKWILQRPKVGYCYWIYFRCLSPQNER